MFSRSKTVGENLKINPALLSRFDLIFILLDKPDEERDQRLSEHVIAVYTYHLLFLTVPFQLHSGAASSLRVPRHGMKFLLGNRT